MELYDPRNPIRLPDGELNVRAVDRPAGWLYRGGRLGQGDIEQMIRCRIG